MTPEVIILDPENEYETLAFAMGGEYVRFRFGSETKINPFDLALWAGQDANAGELSQKYYHFMDSSVSSWESSRHLKMRY